MSRPFMVSMVVAVVPPMMLRAATVVTVAMLAVMSVSVVPGTMSFMTAIEAAMVAVSTPITVGMPRPVAV